MDLIGYIKMNVCDVPTKHRFGVGEYVSHITFKVLYSTDKDAIIPYYFKKLRFIRLIDHCIENGIVNKNNIFYHLSPRHDPKNLQLNGIVFKYLSLVDLTTLSKILPAQDILEYIKFKASEPYRTIDSDCVYYDLYCDVLWKI